MARPKKCRRVCQLPRWGSFGPTAGGEGQVVMTVDEFECLRLIDWEGMTQEQCAAQMMVARATAAAIYEGARHKLADALVNGRTLTIAGGQVALCPHREDCCGRCGRGECGACRRACGRRADELSQTLE